TQIRELDYDSFTGTIIAGSQDTGTISQNVPDGPQWRTLAVGHGEGVAVDNNQAAESIRYYTNSQGELARTRFDSNNVPIGVEEVLALAPNGGSPAVDLAGFTGLETHATDANRLLIFAANGIFESTDGG